MFPFFLIPINTGERLCDNNEGTLFRCASSLGRTFCFFRGLFRVEIYRITFIGHREIDGQYDLEDRIEKIVRDKLCIKEYVEFYVGRNGDFDLSVASSVKRAQKTVGDHNSSLILVQPYPMKDDEYYEKYYDEIYYPVSSKTHPKAAITMRNKWMIEHSDLLIAFVEEGRKGGALTALEYAVKQNVEIINLALQEE